VGFGDPLEKGIEERRDCVTCPMNQWGSALDGNVAGEIAGGVGIALAESGFSREQEVEADDYGIRVSSAAGYSPWGLVNAMEKMKSAGYKTSPNGFNSHPPTDRRLLRLRNNASAIEPRKK